MKKYWKKAIVAIVLVLIFGPVVFVYPKNAYAAIAIDSQESSGTAHRTTVTIAGAQSLTLAWTFTNTAGTKLVCLVADTVVLAGSSALVLNTPTYNGVAMTLVGSQVSTDSGFSKTAIYYLDTPATGANTVSVNGTATVGSGSPRFSVLGGCISFTGVAAGVGSFTSGTDGGTSGTTATAGAITTASGNYIFSGGIWGSGAGGTAGAGFTSTFLLNGSNETAGDDILGEYKASAGGATTPTFTWTGSDFWIIVAVELVVPTSAAPKHKFVFKNSYKFIFKTFRKFIFQ